ncbi:DUF501 domain-containing protein [Neptunomonas phycophila]|uniref:DUF501 domain-containing protein n=1 Tax=Neptunomonas phycophila TaxID=1572645 RepID=A0ABT9ET94_9GAMM|nr:DUF501 domain-containing protein [Neptunomonas phycophila]MDP2522282.1 DUF501 domain-containing protein [Neptunomonas phycophila]
MSVVPNAAPPVTDDERALIRTQIGREPEGLVGIAARSPSGTPLVLQMRSLVGKVPFPTLYWLSSKELGKAIGQIEGKGFVKDVEQRLQHDEALREAYLANQRDYVQARWELMLPEDKAQIEALGFTEMFTRYGIGGISQWDKVRCLHMQYAHHLVAGNVIGELMDQEFALSERDYLL